MDQDKTERAIAHYKNLQEYLSMHLENLDEETRQYVMNNLLIYLDDDDDW